MSADEIQLKSVSDIELMRAAGLVVADTLQAVRTATVPGVSTAELDELAYESITAAGAKPSFLGYFGYPASICASVNHQVVHAIPSKNQVLKQGDIISIDCGAALDGWHGDSAITILVGGDQVAADRTRALAQACEDAMWAGIKQMRPGARLTDISHAIEQAIRASGKYGIVRGYGGHGIGTEMHQDPHVLNYGKPGQGPTLVPGMVLAIEPMITLGKANTKELADGWTVVTKDGSVAAHTEHSVAIMEDGPWALTAHDGGRQALGAAGSTHASAA